jgi:hypothetical protein
METAMTLRATGALAGALLFLGLAAAAAQDVVITPEQDTVIMEHVKKKPLASINLPGVELNVGSSVPDTVELHTFDTPDIKYKYTVVENKTVLVDPDSRKIVKVYD